MNGGLIYSIIKWSLLGTGVIVFITLFFITAPYGRHKRKGWGPEIRDRIGWIIMESVSPIGFLIFFFLGDWNTGVLPYLFLGLWMTHYLYRSFVFSALIRGEKTMPFTMAGFAIIFNAGNSFIQSNYLYSIAGPAGKYSLSWLWSPQFIIGAVLFFTGFVIHVKSDHILRNLREPGEKGYKIPRGWVFRWISCPNYFGEMIEWIGWAVLTWSVPGAIFALWTFFNLFPRAIAHHRWYREQFPDYPEDRKAVVPGIF